MKAFERVIDVITFGSVAAIGLLMVPSAYEPFRHPKLMLLHAAGITLIGLLSAAVIAGAIPRRELIRRTPAFLLVGAILLWTAITAVASAHLPTAAFAFLTAASTAAIFVAAVWSAKRYPAALLLAVLVPSAVNAGLAILQELQIWNEIAPYEIRTRHIATIGLLGNPNDVGSYLVPGLIVAAAWFLAVKRAAHRLLLAPAVLLILGGILASRTRGAILGAAVGLAALAIVRWRMKGAIRIGALAVAGALGIAFFAPQIFERFSQTPVEALLSGRIIAFASAWRMFVESPLLGVGPGCFEYAYFDTASRVYPTVIEYSVAGRQFMFGEAHNDHLQIAAETGLIGWLLFAASLVTVGAASRMRVTDDAPVRVRFARLCGAALAAALAALALFQFPLYLAAPLSAFVCTAAIVIAWCHPERGCHPELGCHPERSRGISPGDTESAPSVGDPSTSLGMTPTLGMTRSLGTRSLGMTRALRMTRIGAAVVVLVLTAAVLYAAVYKRLVAQIGLREAATMTGRVMARETPSYLRPGLAHDALSLLARLRSGSHDDQRVAMLRGMNELSLGRSADAAESYTEALSWGQRPEIYVVLASAQAAQERTDAAIESLDHALRFDPASIINIERADLRAEAFRRFEARATKAEIAELYLSIAIAYFDDGLNREGVETAALAATHDPQILQRPELLAWGYLQELSAARYAELQRTRG